MATLEVNSSGPNIHLPISIPAPLRARIDAEAAERKCTRASIVLMALNRWYGIDGGTPDGFRPTGESHRDDILRFAATQKVFTYADAAGATGLEYGSARRYVLQLADAGSLERLGRTAGLARRFSLVDAAEK